MNFDKVQVPCPTCGGWHFLKDLEAIVGTQDITYYCPVSPPWMLRVAIAFELNEAKLHG